MCVIKKSKKIKKKISRLIELIFKCKDNNVLENSFIRDRSLNFCDIILMVLGRKGRTLSMELFDFYRKAEKHAVSKQDFSKQRQKIGVDFFKDSLEVTVKDIYVSNKLKTYKGYYILGIDGSKTILPRVKELEEKYGLAQANEKQQKCVQCTISGCYDCLNNIMIDIEVGPYASDERELAKKNIKKAKEILGNRKIIIIFDRGYPSIEMLKFLDDNGIKYIIRLQDNTYSRERREMKSNDEEVEIKLTRDRLTGKMDEKTYNELKKQGVYKTRFVKHELPNGNIEWLVTNLDKKELSGKQVGELYFKRWRIEEAFKTLKSKLQIENISGRTDLTALQDIYATIIVYNMIELIALNLEDEIQNKPENKYDYKLNRNVLIGAFKDLLIDLIITEKEKKRKQLYELLCEYVLRYKTPIRENTSNERVFRDGNPKGNINYKRAF